MADDNIKIDKITLIAMLEAKNKTISELKRQSKEPIAIIGMGCRFPGGADTLQQYWKILSEGVDTISEIPNSRFNVDDYYNSNPDIAETMYPRGGAFIDNIDKFDASFFNIVPNEAIAMDPQQRILMEVTWEALENAQIVPGSLDNSNTGFFVGVMCDDYMQVLLNSRERDNIEVYIVPGNGKSTLAGRVSYTFGFQGPTMSVDTACSSSLVSIDLACQSLRNGTSSIALAAGVNIILSPDIYIMLSRARALAVDSHCKTFDKDADGYARGEGCGVLVLKRLSDAVKNNDNILAIIKGSAVNHDGKSSSLTAPNGVAQEKLLLQALNSANVKPSEVSYVETHGTGTVLGDPIEVNSLGKIYSKGRAPEESLIIGTVKTNIGHTESAAGVAGVIKTVLAMQNKKIPKHLNFKKINPEINLDAISVKIPTETINWKPINDRLIAGVSSFGISGTNAHVIIEEVSKGYIKQQEELKLKPVDYVERPQNILVISAKNKEALNELAKKYIELFIKSKDSEQYLIENIAYSANNFRSVFKERLALVVNNKHDASEKLQAWLDSGESSGVVADNISMYSNNKVAFLFTGQGSQYIGMGKNLYETSPTFKKALDKCAYILINNNYLDKPLLSLMWGDDSKLIDNTKYTQPCLFALEYSLTQLWLSWGIVPNALIGHSVGEYVAACIADVLSLDDGLMLICKRADLMQKLAQDGAMVAIATDEATIIEAIKPYQDKLSIAAINGQQSVVISGNKMEVSEVSAIFSRKNINTKELKVSHAFHSHLLDPMLADFENILKEVKFSMPKFSLISNLTGRVIGNEITTPKYWLSHTREAVRFADGINSLVDLEINNLIEIGPHPILLGMAAEYCTNIKSDSVRDIAYLPSMRRDADGWQDLLLSLGRLYTKGVDINWQGFDKDYIRCKTQLPTYPFQRQRYWAENNEVIKQLEVRKYPLLGNLIRSCFDDKEVYIFDSLISLSLYPYLIGHQVYGNVIVPAAAFVEMGLYSAKEILEEELNNKCIKLSHLVIGAPLVLDADIINDYKKLQLIIVKNQDEYTFKILSSYKNGPYILHVTGDIEVIAPELNVNSIAIVDIQARCIEEINKDALYKHLNSIGLEYGIMFQGIDKIYKNNDNEVLANIILNKDITNENYLIHPTLLDSAFQVMAALDYQNDATEKIAYMPFEIGEILLHSQTIPNKLLVHVISNQKTDDAKIIKVDIKIYEETGNLILSFKDFSVIRADKELLLSSINAQNTKQVMDLFYVLKWHEQIDNSEINAIQGMPIYIICCSDELLAQPLRERFETYGFKVNIVNINNLNSLQQHKYGEIDKVIYISDPKVKLEDINAVNCEYQNVLLLSQYLIKNRVLKASGSLILVMHGAQWINGSQTKFNLAQATLVGLGRVIAIENPELQCKRIDLDPDDNFEVALCSDYMIRELNTLNPNEDQVAFRQNCRYVARLSQIKDLSNLNPYTDEVYLGFDNKGVIDNLEFKRLSRSNPSSGQVEIEVKATGLNFRDVLNVMGLYPGDAGALGGECSGVITKVGTNVDKFKIGDEVFGQAPGAFARYTITDANLVCAKPKNISFEEAAGIPIIFLTVHYSLNILAKLKVGQSILIHSAAGGIGMTAIQIARNIGANIYVTVGNSQKRKLIEDMGIDSSHIMDSHSLNFAKDILRLTNNEGVDVVLNSLTGDFIPKSLEVTKTGGVFVEIGKRDIWSKQQVSDLGKDISYHIVAIDSLSMQDPVLVGGMLQDIMREFTKGSLKPVSTKVYSIDKAKEAFRYMAQGKHAGKLILTWQQDHKSQVEQKLVTISDAKTYLITGGLGGLGLEVAKWLAKNGAKHLVLTSRNSPNKQATTILEEISALGVDITLIPADVANSQDVAALFTKLKDNKCMLAGIIHAAGILEDSTILEQNFDKYIKVINPKILGAINLYKELENQHIQLDFFVLFSSIASVLGNIGQANYAAANSFLDTFTYFLNQGNKGVVNIGINWGPWSQVGMIANMDVASREQLSLSGMKAISTNLALNALERILLGENSNTELLVMDVVWSRFLKQSTNMLYSEIHTEFGRKDKDKIHDKTNEFVQKLTNANAEDRYEILSKFLEDTVVKVLGLNKNSSIDRKAGLTSIGMDSLMAVEFRNIIIKNLGDAFTKALPATLMFNYPNIEAITRYLLSDVLSLVEKEVSIQNAYQERQDEIELQNIDQMSSNELSDELTKMISLAEKDLNKNIGDEDE